MVNNKEALNEIMHKIDSNWEDEVEFLQEIGRFPSTQRNEQALQNHLAKFFENDLKMNVDRIIPDMKELSQYRNFSTAEWPYDGREVIIATSEPDGEPVGKSLIFQGHAWN